MEKDIKNNQKKLKKIKKLNEGSVEYRNSRKNNKNLKNKEKNGAYASGFSRSRSADQRNGLSALDRPAEPPEHLLVAARRRIREAYVIEFDATTANACRELLLLVAIVVCSDGGRLLINEKVVFSKVIPL